MHSETGEFLSHGDDVLEGPLDIVVGPVAVALDRRTRDLVLTFLCHVLRLVDETPGKRPMEELGIMSDNS